MDAVWIPRYGANSFISHYVQIKPFHPLPFIPTAVSFISHYVQIKLPPLSISKYFFFVLYIPLRSNKTTNSRPFIIPTTSLYIPLRSNKTISPFTFSNNRTFFISHYVQIKRRYNQIQISSIQSFISHYVQIKPKRVNISMKKDVLYIPLRSNKTQRIPASRSAKSSLYPTTFK